MASSSSSSAAPSRPASVTSFRSATRRTASARTNLILGVAVVNFDHNLGPIVEWAHPPAFSDPAVHPDLTSSLPFCALPDGSHLSDEDFAHFHLHCPTISKHSTVFGISCNRQIASDKLLVRGKDVTRSTVQKAVVVLARQVSERAHGGESTRFWKVTLLTPIRRPSLPACVCSAAREAWHRHKSVLRSR